MDLGPAGDLFLAGFTHGEFPGTNGAEGMFIAKLSASDLSILYSTVVPDTAAYDIALDSTGAIYVTGTTENPTLGTNALLGGGDAFVAKYASPNDYSTQPLSPIWGTYLGGTGADQARAVALYESGAEVLTYVTGRTSSTDFLSSRIAPPSNAASTQLRGEGDPFVLRLNHDGEIDWGTYLGGTDRKRDGSEWGDAIAIDSDGAAWVTGGLTSSDFNAGNAPGAFQTASGSGEAFAAKIDPSDAASSLQYFTYLGGSDREWGYDISVHSGSLYIVGETSSSNFPVANPLFGSRSGKRDSFVARLDPSVAPEDQLILSTYLGGSNEELAQAVDVDDNGSAYVGGWTESGDFPVTQNAFDSTYESRKKDATVTKISFGTPAPNDPPTAQIDAPTSGLEDVAISF